MATIGTRIYTWLNGRRVGRDALGNVYYEEKRPSADALKAKAPRIGAPRARRWVIYAGLPEASKVPPEWHSWLHYTTDAPLPELGRKPWQKPHLENLTGTPFGYRPAGHDYSGGLRARATGDYESWTPDGPVLDPVPPPTTIGA